nr:GlsB/YeaQ/YmgE family stress response membrane protein [Brevundimonas diminuta]
MGGFGFIAWIIIGIIAGWLAEKIMKRDHGLLTNLIVGVVGALIGGFLAGNLLGVDADGNWIVGIIVATIGAVVLLFLLGLMKRRT